ncbi:hypothetical protein A9Z42_0012590 [Trichoderma parareesei]|uniref:Uncharacterized protein n=1 Tax=Trichoderma parareesei TaxID=858221 RepID=A0A2H2YWR9_TRIPA|nr:hypothetical protein A9Z42_0012590 [Trichoderma parareesei]
MPYVDNDIPLATKRKWNHAPNDDEPYNRSSSHRSPREASEPFHASTISPTPTRKTLHPTKRLRAHHHQDSDHDIHSSHHRLLSPREPSTVETPGKVTSTALLPCHVCHRRPTKKSDLDSFARCQSCCEQTCFICMRECQQQRAPYSKPAAAIIRKEDEGDEDALSRSFRMDDADATPSIPHADYNNDDVDVDIGDDDDDDDDDAAHERKTQRYTHHSMICSRCCVEKGAEGEVICLGCLSDPYANTP